MTAISSQNFDIHLAQKYIFSAKSYHLIKNFPMFFHLLDLLTPSERSILFCLWGMEIKSRAGIYSGVFPSRKKIAQVAKVSEDTVKRFIRRFKNDDFLKTLLFISERSITPIGERKTFSGKKNGYRQTSNSYEMGDAFFLFLSWLHLEGAAKNWKKNKSRISTYVSRGNQFVTKRLGVRFSKLSTSRCPPPPHRFAPPLLDILLIYFEEYYCSTIADPPSVDRKSIIENEKGKIIETVFSMAKTSVYKKQDIYRKFTISEIDLAAQNYLWSLSKMGSRIRNPLGLFYNRLYAAKEFLKKQSLLKTK